MKNLSRLTALLLAVMLLLGVNASATELEGGIPLAELDASAYAALLAEASGEETLSFPCEEKPEYCLFSEYSHKTASELYDYFMEMYAEDGDGEMSVRYSAVMIHYGEYHLDSNLICTCGEHPLPLPDYQVGDISAHEETCPWHFANLTVPEQYAVICLVSEEEQPAYYAVLSAQQETELKDYIADIQGAGCTGTYVNDDGTVFNCSELLTGKTPVELYATLMGMYDEGTTLEDYMFHLFDFHADLFETKLCSCSGSPLFYAPGSKAHGLNGVLDDGETLCAWHPDFAGVYYDTPGAQEFYAAYQQLDIAGKAYYLSGMDADQRAAMEAVMSGKDREDKDYLEGEGLTGWTAEERIALVQWLRTEEIAAWRSQKTPAAETLILARKELASNPNLELNQAMAINRRNELMWLYEDQAMADITDTGYVIDIATGIAVGTYSEDAGLRLGIQ